MVEQPALIRLSKIMSQRGLCSRREADYYIERGWVEVDGIVVDQLGFKIRPDQDIVLTRSAKRRQASRTTVIINKPLGIVSGQPEDGYRSAVSLLLPENFYSTSKDRGDNGKSKGPKLSTLRQFAPAGRLDIDSQGLLVLTQDGRVAKQLIAPDSDVEKEYRILVEGDISEPKLRKLRHGLELDGRKLKPAQVNTNRSVNGLSMILKEGRKRQIRRMCELVDLRVTNLRRVRIGNIRLGRLPRGRWRFLNSDENF